jgi:uncharacterized protein (DUF302 family)
MTAVTQTQSLSAVIHRTFDEALVILRSALQAESIEIVREVPFHLAFQKSMGVSCRKYTVLVVWSQFEAWRAVLTESDTGLLMPFNIVVRENGSSTVIAIDSWTGRRSAHGTVGISMMLRDIETRIRRALEHCVHDPRSAWIET